MLGTSRILVDEVALADWAQGIERSALQEMLSTASRPGILSFALGLPAAELFPAEALALAGQRVLASDPRALQYAPPFQPLKAHIVELMAQRGVQCRVEQIFLTAGAQQAMNLLARLLLNRGGQVMTEELSYTGFQQVIEPFQPEVLALPTSPETGLDADVAESLLASGARPAFIYTVTDGHNPLGVSLSTETRHRLAELARHYRVPIIEDDAYGFLYYDDTASPPIRALDDQWVLYVGSFSKLLAPALRVGWIIAPEKLMPKLSIVKEATDIDTSTFTQRVISAYLDEGQLPDHIATLRREYCARRDAMHYALKQHFPAKTRWKKPRSGVFFWVELPNGVNTSKLLKYAIEVEQVAFIPGDAFRVANGRRATQCMRLNFSNLPVADIKKGIARIAQASKLAFA